MNENRISGTVKDAAGQIEKTVGDVTGNAGTQLRGKARQASGQVQEAYGEAVDAVRSMASEQPLMALALAGGIGLALGLLLSRR